MVAVVVDDKLALQLGALEKLGEVFEMLAAHLFLDAVGTEIVGAATHIEARLIDRVA